MALVLDGSNDTITGLQINSANIVDGSIVNADINSSAAIASTKISGSLGKVLQVVEGASTSQVSLSTTTYSYIGITADITPQTNSKVLVLVNFAHNMNSSSEEGFGIKLLRGSTALYTSSALSEWYAYTASSGQFLNRATFNFYDSSPGGNGSTSLTYKIQAATFQGRDVKFVDGSNRSTITLIEIGA